MELLKKIAKSLLIGSLMGLSMAIFSRFFLPDLFDRLENLTYYMRVRWQNAELSKEKIAELEESDNGIYIIDIDDRSMQKLGLYWNWDRSYHARMIDTLSRYFPAAVIFDVLFNNPEDENHRRRLVNLLDRSAGERPDAATPDRSKEAILSAIDYDRQLIRATKEAGVVFHGVCLADEAEYHGFALSQVRHKMTTAWHDSLNPSSAITPQGNTLASIRENKPIIDGIFPDLARAARAIGHVNFKPTEDGVLRESPLLYRFGDHGTVYFPISVRAVASLFGTPNEEIIFEPGGYIDIGKPFKIFSDSAGTLTCSYPSVTALQIRAICEKKKEIFACPPKRAVEVTSFCAAFRDSAGRLRLEMNAPGTLPPPLCEALAAADPGKALALGIKEETTLAPGITLTRESENEWVARAPFDAEEWPFTRVDLETVARLSGADLSFVPPGGRALLFHTLTVRNRGGELVSSLPVLRGPALRELCLTGWDRIAAMRRGSRMDFGRDIRIPLQPGNRHIITYFGPKAKTFRTYSFYDILENKARGEFEGKIFLVGSTAPALFDLKTAPHANTYPGVEVHASLMTSFLTDSFVRKFSASENCIILLLLAVAIGILSYLLKPLAGGILTLLAVTGHFLVALTLFGDDRVWIDIARPLFAMLLTYTGITGYRYVTEEKDRKFLQNTFKQYLSPELIDIMYRKRQLPELGGDEGVRTAFFTDIQGFSTFSEKLGSPRRIVELLNEYLSEMTAVLHKHYGTLDKYEGDAILAFFGAPMPMQDHAFQACLTALDMQDALGRLREKWKSEGDTWPAIVRDMRMRIGINTGLIVTGNMGSKVRKSYTMMGDAVNLAARLESAAKQYGVYTMISNHTYGLVKNEFEARRLDTITVVGKSEPVVVYELVARKGALDEKTQKLLALHAEGLNYFYAREWDRAIDTMSEADIIEPYKAVASDNMTPSKRIIDYCIKCKKSPPGPEWDGVFALTSK